MKIPAALALGALAGFALCGLGVRACWKGPDPAVLAYADSIIAEEQTSAAERDSLLDVIAHLGNEAARPGTAEQQARSERRHSDALADSLQRVRTLADSVPVLVAAVASLTSQRDSLDTALAQQKWMTANLLRSTLDYADKAEARIRDLEGALDLTRRELGRMKRPRRCTLGAVTMGYTVNTQGAGLGATFGASCRIL